MSYQLYRNTTLGNTLQEALDELMQMKLLNDDIALKVLKQFDSSVNAALSGRVKTKLNFKADKLDTYRQVITQLLVVFLFKNTFGTLCPSFNFGCGQIPSSFT